MGKLKRNNIKRMTVDINTDVKDTAKFISKYSGIDICMMVEESLDNYNKLYVKYHPEVLEKIEKVQKD